MTRFHSSSGTRWTGPPPVIPAALTLTSSEPNSLTASRTRRLDRGLVGDVTHDVGVLRGRVGDGLPFRAFVAVEADDDGALLREAQRTRVTDAGRRPRHERDLIIEPTHRCLLMRRPGPDRLWGCIHRGTRASRTGDTRGDPHEQAHDGRADAGLLARSLALGLASGMRSTLGFNAPGLRGVRQDGLTRRQYRAAARDRRGTGRRQASARRPAGSTPRGPDRAVRVGCRRGVQLASRAGAAARTRVVAAARSGRRARRAVPTAERPGDAGASAGAHPRPDWQGAVVEDAVALSLAAAASR